MVEPAAAVSKKTFPATIKRPLLILLGFSIESPSSPMQLSFGNQSCDPFTPREQPCKLGNIVSYAVNATSPNHIASALEFAQKHNIRFVVRNTGHE
jgi:hypothetical protein